MATLREMRLAEALQDAIEALERAEPNLHSPWCNGVHEGTACEGDYLMGKFMDRLRAALSEGDAERDRDAARELVKAALVIAEAGMHLNLQWIGEARAVLSGGAGAAKEP